MPTWPEDLDDSVDGLRVLVRQTQELLDQLRSVHDGHAVHCLAADWEVAPPHHLRLDPHASTGPRLDEVLQCHSLELRRPQLALLVRGDRLVIPMNAHDPARGA